MNNLTLFINGSLELSFFEMNRIAEVTSERAEDIKANLKSGNYIIGLADQVVSSLPNLEPIATFKFEVGDDTEYSYDE